MMDMVAFNVLFTSSVRIAESGGSATAVSSVFVVSSLVYLLVCLMLGHLVTPRNAVRIIIAATALTVLNAGAFVLLSGLRIMYLWLGIQAIAVGCFFVPFQIFMKAVDQGRSTSICRSVGLYTFSWSMGLCCGPFVAGYLWELFGWQWCHAVNAIAAGTIAVGIFLLRHHGRVKAAKGPPKVEPVKGSCGTLDYSGLPDFAWLGWLCAGIGCLAFYTIFGLFPTTAQTYSIPKATQGTVLALIGGAQALTGLILIRSRIWMYLVRPVILLGLLGMAGSLLFGCSRSVPLFCVAAICFGIYSGSFFFYLVFHSLVHPTHSSRYVAINESIVGICGIVGPLSGGLMADHFSLNMPYYVAAAMVAAAFCFKAFVHWQHTSQIRGAIKWAEPEK